MKIEGLKDKPNLEGNKKLNRKYVQLEALVEALNKKELPGEIVDSINKHLRGGDSSSGKELGKQIRKAQSAILKLIEKDLKLVPMNHYRDTWLAIGVALGVAFGSVFGSTTGNISLLGLGIPLGLAIGIAIGTELDKTAKRDGKQLDVEIKY